MSQDLLTVSQDFEHGRLVDVSTHSQMSPVFMNELEVDALSQDLLEDTEVPIPGLPPLHDISQDVVEGSVNTSSEPAANATVGTVSNLATSYTTGNPRN